jgi:two-component system sensor histidine kinase RegB
MTVFPPFLEDQSLRHRLRLQTLTRLRWLAVAGQSLAVVIIAHGYGFEFPEALCFALIACSAWLNVFLSVRFPAAHRLPPLGAMAVLSFDVLQLSGLLFMTGGLANPFSVLLCVPVIISSASQPVRHTVGLGALSVAAVTLLAFYSLPLPWYPDSDFEVPFLLIAGAWIAIVSTTVFAAVYAYQVSAEATQLADALVATELVLQREQHISALDGLAAAAAHELGTPLATIFGGGTGNGKGIDERPAICRRSDVATQPERTLPRYPSAPDHPFRRGRSAYGAASARIIDRRDHCATSGVWHRN